MPSVNSELVALKLQGGKVVGLVRNQWNFGAASSLRAGASLTATPRRAIMTG
jgi:hypothetical protein